MSTDAPFGTGWNNEPGSGTPRIFGQFLSAPLSIPTVSTVLDLPFDDGVRAARNGNDGVAAADLSYANGNVADPSVASELSGTSDAAAGTSI